MTSAEQKVVEALASAWDGFIKLDGKLPGENKEFETAIHAAQYLVAFRVARRADPEIWTQPE
jgi:hypothetical protein